MLKHFVLAAVIATGLFAIVRHSDTFMPWTQQRLITFAWERTLQGESEAAPWPGFDSRPVAKLSVARLNKNLVILEGTSGDVLSLAPGWSRGTDVPGMPGVSLITAPRDTHFSFLRNLRPGDILRLQTVAGSRDYTVEELKIVMENDLQVSREDGDSVLLLSTWLPFANWQPDGARFIAVARASGKAKAITS